MEYFDLAEQGMTKPSPDLTLCRVRCAAAALLIMALAGCGNTAADLSGTDQPQTRVLASPLHCGHTDPLARLLTSKDDWVALGRKLRTPLPVLAGDDLAVLVSFGQQPTAGYQILDNGPARRDNARLILPVRVQGPQAGMLQAQVITTPCVIISLPPGDWTTLQIDAGNMPFPAIQHP